MAEATDNFPEINLNHRVLAVICSPNGGGLDLQKTKDCIKKFSIGFDEVNVFLDGQVLDEQSQQSVMDCNRHVSLTDIPKECSSSMSKIHNFICRHEHEKNSGKWDSWFLYIVKDAEFNHEMIWFLIKLEIMMKNLGIHAWMNTATDSCNYFLTKYNPRFKADLTSSKGYSSLLPFKTVWCSHCNDNFMAYWMNGLRESDMLFNESFEIPMYYIISYIARLKADKSCSSFKFMNMYPTVDGEDQLIKTIDSVHLEYSQEEFNKENKIFEDLKLDHSPDNSIDSVLDFMKDRLDSTIEDGKKDNS